MDQFTELEISQDLVSQSTRLVQASCAVTFLSFSQYHFASSMAFSSVCFWPHKFMLTWQLNIIKHLHIVL